MKRISHILNTCLLLFVFCFAGSAWGQTGSVRLVMEEFGSFGGAIDEEPFKAALQSWVQHCNKTIEQFEGLSPQEADKLFFEEDFLQNMLSDQPLYSLQESLEPLLARWTKHWDLNALSENDRKVVAVLEQFGLKMISTEGDAYLAGNTAFFNNLFKPFLSAEALAYLTVKDQIPTRFFKDAGLMHSIQKVGDWAVLWEQYLALPDNGGVYRQHAAVQYTEIMDILLFCIMDNTPAFPRYNEGRMKDDWIRDLQAVSDKYPTSKTGAIIEDFLTKIKKDGNKLAPATQTTITARITEVASATLTQKTTSQKALTPAEKKLMGKHMFSLQWVSHEKFGIATVTQKGDGLYIDARQEFKGNYVTLQGAVTVINDKEFNVTGELVTCVTYNNNGNPCVRNETFTFKASGKRKYWRMQEMLNPCENGNHVDYVDVYF